jgi:hypothetical protein
MVEMRYWPRWLVTRFSKIAGSIIKPLKAHQRIYADCQHHE